MNSGYRIAEVARRSGFPAATLRYYEDVGVLPEPARTAAGYRVYDDEALGRLAFIARAKQLGCSLEEIAELSAAWDGGECGPVQDRLRRLVAAKLTDARERIAELTTLTADLESAAAALERHRPEGPCDDRCGCTSEPPRPTVGALCGAPDPAPADPIACTLDPSALEDRLYDWQTLLADAARRVDIDGGVRVEFRPGVSAGAVAALVAAEQDCCGFLAFALTVDDRGLGLDVHAPPDALPMVQALFGTQA